MPHGPEARCHRGGHRPCPCPPPPPLPRAAAALASVWPASPCVPGARPAAGAGRREGWPPPAPSARPEPADLPCVPPDPSTAAGAVTTARTCPGSCPLLGTGRRAGSEGSATAGMKVVVVVVVTKADVGGMVSGW